MAYKRSTKLIKRSMVVRDYGYYVYTVLRRRHGLTATQTYTMMRGLDMVTMLAMAEMEGYRRLYVGVSGVHRDCA